MLGVLVIVVATTLVGIMKANRMSQSANEVTEATIRSQNLIEYAKANGQELEEALEAIGGLSCKQGYIFYYDKNWNEVKEEDRAVFIIAIQIQEVDYKVDTLIKLSVISYKEESQPFLSIQSNLLKNEIE